MDTLNFKQWLEDSMNPNNKQQADQAAKNVGQAGIAAAITAQKNGKNPVKAMQQSILQQAQAGKIPTNKLGDIIPKDPNESDVN